MENMIVAYIFRRKVETAYIRSVHIISTNTAKM